MEEELNCTKDEVVLSGRKVLDEPIYLKSILTKLPRDVQNRWQKHAFRYMKTHDVDYPGFSEFVDFMEEISREKNDPNLSLTNTEDETKETRSQASKPRRALRRKCPMSTASTEESRHQIHKLVLSPSESAPFDPVSSISSQADRRKEKLAETTRSVLSVRCVHSTHGQRL